MSTVALGTTVSFAGATYRLGGDECWRRRIPDTPEACAYGPAVTPALADALHAVALADARADRLAACVDAWRAVAAHDGVGCLACAVGMPHRCGIRAALVRAAGAITP